MTTLRSDWPAQVVASVGAALDAQGVTHELLKEWAPLNNLTVTDEELVFVKVSRRGKSAVTELAAAEWASHVIPVPQAVLPFQVEAGGRFCSVWRWQNHDQLLPSMMSDEFLRLAVADLARLHHGVRCRPAPDEVVPVALVERIDARIRMYPPTVPALRVLLNQVVTCVAQQFEVGSAEKPELGVVTHGDPHLSNLLSVAGQPLWVDWESSAWAFPEWDIASVALSVQRHRGVGWRDAHDIVVRWYEATSLAPVNRDHLHLCALAKASSAVSFELMLDDRDEPDMVHRLEHILEAVTW